MHYLGLDGCLWCGLTHAQISAEDQARYAQPTAHALAWVSRSSLHWHARCSCGWFGTDQTMERDAITQHQAHVSEARP